ncbi:MAG: hypothetical protein IKP61_02995 [Spirochaetales bacterium]|nr:hypothetical protein [Spirochaetales bacterium]
MRKILSILLVLLLLFAFVSCDELGLETEPENEGGGNSQSGTGEGTGEGGGGSQGGGGAEDASADTGSGSGPVQSEYKVGDIGPAGGYIFYDRGYYENGWRYLEAAPADMKVINGVPTVDATSDAYKNAEIDDQYVLFGYYRLTDDGDDVYVNGTTTWDPTDCTQSGIGAGKTNTQLLLNAMGDTAYEQHIYTFNGNHAAKSAVYAAKVVDQLTYTYGGKTYNDWFIPSLGELNQMYQQLYLNELGGFGAYTYASSSECDIKNYSQNTDLMKAMSFSTGAFDQVVFRGSGNRIRPARAF